MTTGSHERSLALVVARDLTAAVEVMNRHGLRLASVGAPPAPTVRHVPVALDAPDAGQVLARLAGTHGWLVLLAPAGAYRRAATLLILATRLPTTRRVLAVEELLVYQVLAATSEEEQEEVVRDVLGPILDLPAGASQRLLATLEALHWNEGSSKATARALGLHSKTVLNRLRRFEEMTGLCLDRPPDRLRVDVALYLLRIRGRLPRIDVAGVTPTAGGSESAAAYAPNGASRMGWVRPVAVGTATA
ncbi:MAG TPA: helix-turn-helix domain-containing protein [Acidimicrobiales bacterium]